VFLAKSKEGDYHQEMNSFVFLDWFENQLMPAMKNPSLFVLANASYHNVKTEDTLSRGHTSGSGAPETRLDCVFPVTSGPYLSSRNMKGKIMCEVL
jgi:hypothetical protein